MSTPAVKVKSQDAVEGERGAALRQQMKAAPAALFQFPPELRTGELSDRYFVRAMRTLALDGLDPLVTMQVFSKKTGIVAGIPEAIRMLQVGLAGGYGLDDIEVRTLLEGDHINVDTEWEPVMHIAGPYRAFAHLETPLLGVLARRSLVATNTAAAVKAAGDKPLIFMAPRHDDWRVQCGDGYAALVGGAAAVSSDVGGQWAGVRAVGTMPHALIAAYGGDTIRATLAFARYVKAEEPHVDVVSLVDYDNDVIGTSLDVARAMRTEFGAGTLTAVRVDTSERLIDRALVNDPEIFGRHKATGVNPHLVRKLRAALDEAGFSEVGIIVSGGFTPKKIAAFENGGVPVAGYGVGSSLLGHNDGTDGLKTGFDFTGDIVVVDGCREAKLGRRLLDSDRLVRVQWGGIA